MTRAPLTVLLVLLLGGCAIFGGPADKALRKTPSWRDGYQDGCAAATDAHSNFRKGPLTDNAMYRTDKIYRSGWGNGYQTCRGTLTPGTRANAPGPDAFQDPSPGHQ
jgi:hypothetical protein